jgi:hypothetical protein
MPSEPETTALVVVVEKTQVREVMRRLSGLHTEVIESVELWGERGVTLDGRDDLGHLAAMKDLHYETGPPDDSVF